jgi:hypothetical protein
MATEPATVADLPVINPPLIRKFLAATVGEAIHLVSIVPDGGTKGAWFGDDVEKATAWAVSQNQSGRGLYWTVNVVREGLDKKPTKRDIQAARFLHVDIDPPFDRAELLDGLASSKAPPSFIIDSGNGLQAFWRLDYAAENLPAVEDLNRRLSSVFGGDHCHNIDRLLRLPGTVNYPNAKKRGAGRVPTVSSIVEEDGGESVDPADMDALLPPLPPEERTERERVELSDVTIFGLEELRVAPGSRLHNLIVSPTNPDRSGAAYAVACEMIRRGYSDQQIAGVLLNPDLAISGHCLDQASPKRAAARAIAGAKTEARPEAPDEASGSDEPPVDTRPEIEVRAGCLHLLATAGEDALIGGGAPLYVRGGAIVRPIIDLVQAAHGRRTKVARLASVDGNMLVDHLSRHARWVRWNARKKGLVATDPPRDVAATILSRDGEWRFLRLAILRPSFCSSIHRRSRLFRSARQRTMPPKRWRCWTVS